MKKLLVLGGSGALGQALLHELAGAGAAAAFTYHRQADAAAGLSARHGFAAHQTDLRRPDAIESLFATLAGDGFVPDAVVHCAGIGPTSPLAAIGAGDWDEVHAIHGRAALQCAQQMLRNARPGALVLVAALDGLVSMPAAAHYAASQAALWGLTLALAKELGPAGILVNLAVVGALDAGISRGLSRAQREGYERFSALGRVGRCAEAARALRWLALENTYLHGAQFPLSGGLG